MACEYCLRDEGHATGCPNFVAPSSKYNCEICGCGILDGEEYVENLSEEYAHWDCLDSKWELLEFLGYEKKEMEDDEY